MDHGSETLLGSPAPSLGNHAAGVAREVVMTVDDQAYQKTYREWLEQALDRDADRWAELELELARLREKAHAVALGAPARPASPSS
jgi:hypothetical protein